jgi:quercetin dioxygenase-like cupin family protein
MDNTELFKKSFFENQNIFDFNELVNYMDKYNLPSSIKSNYLNNFITQSTFAIKNVHDTVEFKNILEELNSRFNEENKPNDLEIFFSMMSGASGIMHKDPYDVYIIGLFGNTVYKVEDFYYEVEPGDLLKIPKNYNHKSIALTPRIILSYVIYGT